SWLNDHPSCPPRAWLRAQYVLEAAPSAAARVCCRRCVAADGRGEFRGLLRPDRARQGNSRAAARAGACPHAASPLTFLVDDLRKQEGQSQTLFCEGGGIDALIP